ncbi:hypothetical protein IAQ61_009814 [Plenodomus lingam]|uniref:uncharacterized protein n=1 Tax=Leptosphaeria maculans TaxID=5022 RepID=UPI0033347F99|nr:hypothetical protein IAQ61_009814 [Plenodomus lingam]
MEAVDSDGDNNNGDGDGDRQRSRMRQAVAKVLIVKRGFGVEGRSFIEPDVQHLVQKSYRPISLASRGLR